MASKSYDRTHALYHCICAVIVAPYVTFALLVICGSDLSSAKDPVSFIATLVYDFFFFIKMVAFVIPANLALLIAIGFNADLQRIGSLCLGAVAIWSAVTILRIEPTKISLQDLLFMMPCFGAAVACCWLFYRPQASLKTTDPE